MKYWYVNLLGLFFALLPYCGSAQTGTSLSEQVSKAWSVYDAGEQGNSVAAILKQKETLEKTLLSQDKKDAMARLANQIGALVHVADFYRSNREAAIQKASLQKLLKGVRIDSKEFLAFSNLRRNVDAFCSVKALADGYQIAQVWGDERDKGNYEKYKCVLESKNPDLILPYFEGIRTDFVMNYTEALKKARPLFEQYMPEGEAKQQVMELYAAKDRLSAGKEAPAFTLIDYKKQEHSLADFKGKILIIDVWATWCGGCIQKLPFFMKVAEKYKERADVEFITISIDTEKKFSHWKYSLPRYQLLGIKNLIAFPEKMPFQDDYDVQGIPRYIMIGKDGKLIDSDLPGPGHGFEEYVDKVLGGSI